MKSSKQNLSGLSYIRCARERQLRGSIIARGERGLDNEMCDTSQITVW